MAADLEELIAIAQGKVDQAQAALEGLVKQQLEYPARFSGNTVFDFTTWEKGKKAIENSVEDTRLELRHLKISLQSLLDQMPKVENQLDLFNST